MKNRFKNYWYSLGDSTRALIRMTSVLILIGLAVISCFIWGLALPILLFSTIGFSICFFVYYTFLMIKDSEEEKRRKQEAIKKKQEYDKRLKEQYDSEKETRV